MIDLAENLNYIFLHYSHLIFKIENYTSQKFVKFQVNKNILFLKFNN